MDHKNAFGLPKHEPKDIFTDKQVTKALEVMFKDWLEFLGIDSSMRPTIIKGTFDSFREYSCSTGILDEKLRQRYADIGIISRIKEGLKGRAEQLYTQIESFINGSVLDMGCGPGEIAQYIHDKKGVPVFLTDIVDIDKRKEFAPNLPFRLKGAGERLPYDDNHFDNSLLIAVLHHSDNPLFELDEVVRVTRGNLIIMESIYGVSAGDSPKEEVARFPELYSRFHGLDDEQQRKYGTFLDWFLNKMILGNKINCPYNFNTPEKWEGIFKERGLSVVHKRFLGMDQPVTPEYHILYVVSKKEDS